MINPVLQTNRGYDAQMRQKVRAVMVGETLLIQRTEVKHTNQCLLPQHVKRALVYMRANLAEKITLPGLAAMCGTPERTLLKQFKRFVGSSPLASFVRYAMAPPRTAR